jgi:DNA-binding winged helix-turn-helix (wHTH) protein
MTVPIETLKEMEKLRARVEELEFELDRLKSKVDTELAALMDYFDLTHNEARIIRAMAISNGAPLSRPMLMECLTSEIEDCRTIDSHVKRIRVKNGKRLPIHAIYGIGYRILPDTVRLVREVMAGKRKPEAFRVYAMHRSDSELRPVPPQSHGINAA